MTAGVLSPAAAAWVAAVAVLGPLALGAAAWIPAARRFVLSLAPWAALPALILALSAGPPWSAGLPWAIAGVRIGVDRVGSVFLLLFAVTWLLAGVSARTSMSRDPRRARFFAFFLLSMSGSVALTLALDAVTFYAGSVLMSLSAYGLVTHRDHDAARRAGRIYLAFALAGEALLATGLFLAVGASIGTDLDDLLVRVTAPRAVVPAITVILLACAVKAGAVPFHGWLSAACTEAPLPSTLVLANVVSKGALLGVLRLVPLGQLSFDRHGVAVVLLSLLAAFYGVAAGVTHRRPKTALAYATISQTGLITAAIGMGIVASPGWAVLLPAALVCVLHVGFATNALFLTLAAAQSPDAPRGATVAALVALAGLGLLLAGLPLTSGAAAMTVLADAIGRSGLPSGQGVVSMLWLAAAGTATLMARLVWMVSSGGPGQPAPGAWIWIVATGLSVLAPWTVLRGLADPAAAWSLGSVPYLAVGLVLGALIARRKQPTT